MTDIPLANVELDYVALPKISDRIKLAGIMMFCLSVVASWSWIILTSLAPTPSGEREVVVPIVAHTSCHAWPQRGVFFSQVATKASRRRSHVRTLLRARSQYYATLSPHHGEALRDLRQPSCRYTKVFWRRALIKCTISFILTPVVLYIVCRIWFIIGRDYIAASIILRGRQ